MAAQVVVLHVCCFASVLVLFFSSFSFSFSSSFALPLLFAPSDCFPCLPLIFSLPPFETTEETEGVLSSGLRPCLFRGRPCFISCGWPTRHIHIHVHIQNGWLEVEQDVLGTQKVDKWWMMMMADAMPCYQSCDIYPSCAVECASLLGDGDRMGHAIDIGEAQ